MAVVGSPEKGLVGIGRGRGVDAAVANRKATTKGEPTELIRLFLELSS
jgi:ribosomal protein S5